MEIKPVKVNRHQNKSGDDIMDSLVFDLQQFCYILRMIVAGICGIIIGLERKNRSKEAGIRTHCVVACAAALMMIVSKYAFFDVIGRGAYGDVEVRLTLPVLPQP